MFVVFRNSIILNGLYVLKSKIMFLHFDVFLCEHSSNNNNNKHTFNNNYIVIQSYKFDTGPEETSQSCVNMNFKSTVAIFLLVVVLMFTTDSINGFRKPPFNGSIFGKRTISYPGTIYTKNSYDTANVHYEQLPSAFDN